MRFMNIPPFARRIEILDFDFFVRSRLNQATVLWPEQAIPLVGYMGWPNDPEGRAASVAVVRSWRKGSRDVPRRLRQIQTGPVRARGDVGSPDCCHRVLRHALPATKPAAYDRGLHRCVWRVCNQTSEATKRPNPHARPAPAGYTQTVEIRHLHFHPGAQGVV